MRRTLIALLAVVTAVAAWAIPAPDTGAGAVAPLPEPPVGTRAAVLFCPGAAGEVDPILSAALPSSGLAGFSLPVDGEILDAFQVPVQSGVGEWDVGDGLFFHPGPAIVETSSTPSGASVVLRGPGRLAADGCYAAAKEWLLTGASIQAPQTLTLRLFNPLLDLGRVELELVSEFGFEPLLDLETFSIPPRSWEDVGLTLALGDRAQIAVRVTVVEGVVIPAFFEAGPDGMAVWPGESPSPTWEFPLAQLGGTSGVLSVWNPGVEPVDVAIELAGRQGTVGRFELPVGPGREERFDIATITTAEVGITATASGAVVASVRVSGPAATAATVGTPRPQRRWLVPSHNVASDLGSVIYVLNSGGEPSEVGIGPIGAEPAEIVSVGPRAIARLEVPGRGAEITASSPVSVSWVAIGGGDVGLAPGIPVAAANP
jgi:hypothetical protein